MDRLDAGPFLPVAHADSAWAERDLTSQEEKGHSAGEDGAAFLGHKIFAAEPAKRVHVMDSENKELFGEVEEVQAIAGTCSRQAEAVEPECGLVEQVGNIEIAEAGISDGAASFEDWVDCFLSIPLDEFRPVDEKVMEKCHDSYQRKIAKHHDKAEVVKLLKSKVLLNRVIYDWQTSQGGEQIKEQTKAKLISLCKYMQSEYRFSGYFKNLVLLKIYRDSLYDKPISDNHRQLLLEVLNSDVLDSNNQITSGAFLLADVYSLQLFYFFGALPGFEDGVNYKKAFDLLVWHDRLCVFFCTLFSHVSFTIFDSARFSMGSIALMQASENELKLTDSLASIMRILVMDYLLTGGKEKERCFSWLHSISRFDMPMFRTIGQVVAEFALFISSLIDKSATPKSIKQFKSLLENSKESVFNKLESGSLGRCAGLFTYMRVHIILNERRGVAKNKRYVLAGRLYSEIAEQNPNHWGTVYFYYHQAGKRELAACAADHASRSWEGKSLFLYEYWSDISCRERDLCRDLSGSGTSVNQDEDYDIDAVVKVFSTMPAPSAVTTEVATKSKQRKRNQRKVGSASSGQHANMGESQGRGVQQSVGVRKWQALLLAPANHSQALPDFGSIPQEANRPGALPGHDMYRIKSAKGSIQSFEKLLSKYWNPRVWTILAAVRKARDNLDIVKERKIYQQVLDNPALKTCVGIERIWEECAWTELHQFDDFFRVGVLTCTMKEAAKKWIENAKVLYILPSLAHFMSLDHISADIDPEAVWSGVMSLLAKPELAPGSVNQEIRFRLRCLFSSMGHIYSLSAMINSRHADRLRQTACVWYGFKTIDPSYPGHNSRGYQVRGKHESQ